MIYKGKHEQLWSEWKADAKDWLASCHIVRTVVYNDDSIHMEELDYRFGGDCSQDTPFAVLEAPFVIDGWINKLHLCSSFTRIANKGFPYGNIKFQTEHDCKKLLNSLNGEFSFALWNKETYRLLISTDIYGSRPVYYFISPERDIIASNSLNILLLCKSVPFRINYSVCTDYFSMDAITGMGDLRQGLTFFENIYKLLPGTALYCDTFNTTVLDYWGLEDILQKPTLAGDNINEFRSILLNAVEDRLAVGARLLEVSGGIDSAIILAAAAQSAYKDSIVGINITFESFDLANRDHKLAAKLLNHLNIPGLVIYADNTLRFQNAESGRDPLTYLDGPDPSANPMMSENIDALALELGYHRVMTGEGGDQIFSGSDYIFDWMLRTGQIHAFISNLWRYSARNLTQAFRLLVRLGLVPFLPIISERRYSTLLRGHLDRALPGYFTDQYRRKINLAPWQLYHQYEHSRPLINWGHRLIFDSLWPRPRFYDVMAGRVGSFAYSQPFFDKRVIEWAFTAPPDIHYNVSQSRFSYYSGSKQVLRKVFMEFLPAYIVEQRSKSVYSSISRRRFQNDKRHLLSLFPRDGISYLEQLDIINTSIFRDSLLAALLLMNDPNSDSSISFKWIEAVTKMEIWLREMSLGRYQVLSRSRPTKPRITSKIDTIPTR